MKTTGFSVFEIFWLLIHSFSLIFSSYSQALTNMNEKWTTYGQKIRSKSVQGLATNEVSANQEFCPLEKLSKSDKSFFITGDKIYLKC